MKLADDLLNITIRDLLLAIVPILLKKMNSVAVIAIIVCQRVSKTHVYWSPFDICFPYINPRAVQRAVHCTV